MPRPRKPDMTDEEYDLAATMLAEERRGCGLRAVADAISRRRGATTLNPARNRRKGVSEWWVRDQLMRREREETTSARKPSAPSESDLTRGNSFDVDGRRTMHQTTAPEGPEDRKQTPEARFAVPEGQAEPARADVDDGSGGV
jgi:hypothetical protein